ncbi:hypothetical protein [Lactococcus petauri]|uniref:hypothetical protein n=1 Tax=Lactococcus petauri TaxID=1940789 RepID=UPI002550C8E6|nr:hypothetical protein [Lactococcus petauri]
MSKYDEVSKDYIPLKSEPISGPSDTELKDEDYLSDFEDFNLEEPEYVKNGPKDEYILELSEGMWTKASSKAVRKIIYLFMRWCGYWVLNLKKWIEQYRKRQEEVEARQTQVENDFKDVIANATQDSEVINARNSDYFGGFTVLDDRLENIEKLLIGFVPQGVEIKINRTMNALPSVYIDTWEYGIGRLPLGEEPAGMFGGTTPKIVENRIVTWANNELVIQVALDFENFKFNYRPESGEYLLFDGVRSLMIHVDGGEPIGDDVDESQVTVTKNQSTPTQSNLLQRLTQLEERIERE